MFELPQISLKGHVSDEEWQLRIDLAACYRLAHYYGWDDTIYTHISARLPNRDEYLVNAFGLTFDEITASNLVKVICKAKYSMIRLMILILQVLPFTAPFTKFAMMRR